MRIAASLAVAAFVLAACGGTAPTPTPDPRAPAGYRRAAYGHLNEIATSVTTAYAACTRDPGPPCASALAQQRERHRPHAAWLRATPPPPGCGVLSDGYLGVVADADAFYDDGIGAASGDDPAATLGVVTGRYERFTAGKSAARSPRLDDRCKE